MKIFYSLIISFISILGYSQNVLYPPDSQAKTNISGGTIETATDKFQDTTGNIDVNGAGQLNFTFPITLPPGVKSVAPQISLAYTSGSGSGIAGYGWNISGITSISRIGKTIEKDGEVKGIQLNELDYYSFNGQRLILKSGEYGKDGAEYVTEKYSNIKIKSVGAVTGQTWKGPEYWEVTFEDGSQAWYGAIASGASTARTPIEYNIVKWKDVQGNYIIYTYTQSENVALLSTVDWGGNETLGKAHFNKVQFLYDSRALQESSYVAGTRFVQNKKLVQITVLTHNKMFRRYSIQYSGTQNTVNNDSNHKIGYEFVEKVIETNAVGEEANPVRFSTKPLRTSTQESSFGDYTNIITTGDYNGDGLVDFVVMQPAQNGRPAGYYIYFDAINNAGSSFVYLGASPQFFPSSYLTTFNIKSSDNYVTTRQGLVITKGNGGSNPPSTGNIELKYYSIKSDASVLNTFNDPLVLEYSKTIKAHEYQFNDSLYPSQPPINSTVRRSAIQTIKEVDIDSDGISELMIAVQDAKCYYQVIVPDPPKGSWRCNPLGYRYIVVDQNDIQNNSFHIIPQTTAKNILSKGGIMDFDNDGIQDIIFIDPTSANVNASFYTKSFLSGNVTSKTISTPTSNLGQYELKKQNSDYMITLKKNHTVKGFADAIQFGDLNGDKNIEVLLPLHEYSINEEYTTGWSIYLNTGAGLEESLQGLMLYKKSTASRPDILSDYSIIDLDNDGKGEIVNSYTFFSNLNTDLNINWRLDSYSEPYYNGNDSQFKWRFTEKRLLSSERPKSNVVPLFGDFRVNKLSSKVLFLLKGFNNSERKLISYQHYNLGTDKNISSIFQANLEYEVEYKELDPLVNGNLYAPVKKEQYPLVEMDRLSQTYAVSQIRLMGRKQDFRYRGYITHLQGKGVIGFRQTARSSWYFEGFENTKIWSGNEIDPLNEGLPIKEWTIRTNDESKIFPADISENNTQLLSFKSMVYRTDKLLHGQIMGSVAGVDKSKIVNATVPKSTITKDFLTGTVTTNIVTYGDHYLPTQSVSNVNNNYAVTTSTFEYLHNPTGVGSAYFVGRPKSKTDVVQAYGDTKSSKEEYTYENSLLKTLKTWNRDNTGYLQEAYTYDGFGNAIQKVASNSIDSQTQTTKAEYEPEGRFVIKQTDNLGLQTHSTYNDWGQILSQTDPLGNVITNTYDNWAKLLTSKTNLEGTTTYLYEKQGWSGDMMGGFLQGPRHIIVKHLPDGDQSLSYTNIMGQHYKTTTKAFGQNLFVSQDIKYDALGRKTAESEPYDDDKRPSVWNVLTYDDSIFPAKVTATSFAALDLSGIIVTSFTGKKAETSILGNTTTEKELNGYGRTTSKTTDALGNVISSTDKGGTIQFSYNAAGQQIKAQYAENIVTTKYDAWGRKSEFNDPSNGIYKYEYDGFGQIKKIISPKGTKEYTYNSLGQLISQKEISTVDSGQATNKMISYSYDQKGRIISKSGTSKGKPYSSAVSYDPQGRLASSSENSNGKQFIQKGITYDDKGRVTSYEKQLQSSGIITTVQIENVYSPWSGELYQVKDKTSGKILWELKETNVKGQVLKAKLGATEINNAYDSQGFLTNVNHSSTVKPGILQLSYSFDAIKNELKSRTTGGDFNIIESFDYDDNNRLINWTNPITGVKPAINRNVYDAKGRITQNDQVGTIKFENSAKIYQPTGMTLNAVGTQNYNNDLIQSIAYNENNDPVFIDGEKGDVAFQYGLTSMRQRVTYGGNFSIDGDGKFTKFYSEDGSFEVLKDNITGKEKHILYIDGTPYESNIVYLKNFEESSGSYKFLHKDYLGSILAISDEAGNKLEQRHFDAWGNFTHLQIGNGAVTTDKNVIDKASLLVDRGYTSHEHFAEVGIIHMNGRLYDPLLRRFLNADENIQEPTNTQNYNKYGYVLNNPLMFNDPNGEFFQFLGLGVLFWKAAIWGAAIGLASYTVGLAVTGNLGQWNIGKAIKSVFWGAVSGAATAGIGSMFTPSAGTILTVVDKVAGTMAQGLAHGFSQGVLSMMQGENFTHGFASAIASSYGASVFGAIAPKFVNSAVGMIASGSLLGGLAAELTGGDFIQGAFTGGIVAALNHGLHLSTTGSGNDYGDGDCPTCPKNAKPGDFYTEKPFSILDKDTWGNFGKTKTYTYFGGKWSELKYITGDVPLGPGGTLKGGKYLVYEGIDALNKVKYVGITRREAMKRFLEHSNSIGTGKELLRYRTIKNAQGLSRIQARIWEQTLINKYQLQKYGGELINKINSVSQKYWTKYGIKP
ncbi:RHS repeat-associated core domain-containing protein [Chryseobacterium fistulae]|uniref:tRNA3(Ser)-specific nuclease WapA n=1 Tax=Chryseobacterium fistulae TaxID=2675058 RepID=A0A6N4XLK7_9FLAO|nr:RHS repeat-associated core domain-containing protein [Chryseobacterium fistulae]CAA7386073.1 tRNA3(Ser)-specific nuclease WapA [Chryseobacterium fistulae]